MLPVVDNYRLADEQLARHVSRVGCAIQGRILTVVRKDVAEVSCLNHDDFHAEIR